MHASKPNITEKALGLTVDTVMQRYDRLKSQCNKSNPASAISPGLRKRMSYFSTPVQIRGLLRRQRCPMLLFEAKTFQDGASVVIR